MSSEKYTVPSRPGLPFPRRVLTEEEAVSHHLRYLADHLGPRPVGSEEGSRARRYILDTVTHLGLSSELQPFPTKIAPVAHSRLLTKDGRVIPCLPVIGSPSTPGAVRGFPRLLSLNGGSSLPSEGQPFRDLGLMPVRLGGEGQAVALAARRGAPAVLLYREDVPDLYSAVIAEPRGSVPCVVIRRADALQLAQETPEVELIVQVEPTEVLSVNIMVGIGKGGQAWLFLANYDTRPGTPGAYRNGSGVAALLELLTCLKGWPGHRIVVGFLDGEEADSAGSRHCQGVLQATGRLGALRGVVYVSGLGLRELSVAPGYPERSSLADLVVQYAVKEGILLSTHPCPAAGELIPVGVWSRAVIALTGPPVAAQYTSFDRPDLLNPRCISKAVSVLDRLARTL